MEKRQKTLLKRETLFFKHGVFKTPALFSVIQTNVYLLHPFISSSFQLCSQMANQNFSPLTCGACGTVAMETTPSPERRCSISTGLLDLPSDHTAPFAWPSGKNKTVNACPQFYLQQSGLFLFFFVFSSMTPWGEEMRLNTPYTWCQACHFF